MLKWKEGQRDAKMEGKTVGVKPQSHQGEAAPWFGHSAFAGGLDGFEVYLICSQDFSMK